MWKVVLRALGGAFWGCCGPFITVLTSFLLMDAHGFYDGLVLILGLVVPLPGAVIAGICAAISQKWKVGAIVGFVCGTIPLIPLMNRDLRWVETWTIGVPFVIGPTFAGAFTGLLFALSDPSNETPVNEAWSS